ncbi:MAG: Rho-binding antiterminator [Oleiphilaceae bacterium]|jgi:Rho-binding antiterminator
MLACDKHDFIEIACMYQLKVVLKLKTGDEIIGIAQDTVLNGQRDECVKLLMADKKFEFITLMSISTMRALDQNPHFNFIQFD